MSKLTNIAAGLAVVPMLAVSASAFADSPGQLTGGQANFQVRNVTQNTAYAASANATCNDELKYAVLLHSAAYGGLTNINVKVTVASGAISATPSEGASAGTSGSVSVTTPANSTLAYEAGSAQLYKVAANGTQTLVGPVADSIATTGANIGNMAGSTSEYVYLKSKVTCAPTPPPTTTYIQVCDLTTKQLITIDQNNFDSSKYSKDTTKCVTPVTTVTSLPNTGAGNVVGIFAGVVVAGFIASRLYLSRKLARKA